MSVMTVSESQFQQLEREGIKQEHLTWNFFSNEGALSISPPRYFRPLHPVSILAFNAASMAIFSWTSFCVCVHIHPKSERIGGDYFSAQKYWRKKCVNLDDKILERKCVLS